MKYEYKMVETVAGHMEEVNTLAQKGWRIIDVRHWSNEYTTGIDFIMEWASG